MCNIWAASTNTNQSALRKNGHREKTLYCFNEDDKKILNTSEHLIILAKVVDCKSSYECLSFPIHFYNK